MKLEKNSYKNNLLIHLKDIVSPKKKLLPVHKKLASVKYEGEKI